MRFTWQIVCVQSQFARFSRDVASDTRPLGGGREIRASAATDRSSSEIEATDKVPSPPPSIKREPAKRPRNDDALFSFFFSFHHRRQNVATDTSAAGRAPPLLCEGGNRIGAIRAYELRANDLSSFLRHDLHEFTARFARIAPRCKKNSASDGRSAERKGTRGEDEEGSFYDGASGRLRCAFYCSRQDTSETVHLER